MSTRHAFWLVSVVFGVSFASVRADPQEARIQRLVRLLGSDNFDERERAEKELVEIGGPALPALRQAASKKDAEVAARAKACIPEIEQDEEASTIARGLSSMSTKERTGAALKLTHMGPRARKAVPALVRALDDPEPKVRECALVALAHIGRAASAAVPRCVELMRDQTQPMDVRWVAATRLAQLAPNPKQVQRVVPLLLEWLEGREWLLQNGAATALGDLNPDDSRVVPALVKALAQEDKRVNINAAAALLSLAKEPEESIPALIRFVNRHKGNPEYSNQRCGIASTMWRFSQKTKSIVPLLIEIAADESESEGVRIGAMDSLARIGPAAQEAIAPLKNLLKATLDTKGDFATAIRRALEGIERRE